MKCKRPAPVLADYSSLGLRPILMNRMSSGAPFTAFVAKPPVTVPRIAVIEEYTTSSYLGNYGAGRVVKTFTLLPGERTTITLRTYKDMMSTRDKSQNVLELQQQQFSIFEIGNTYNDRKLLIIILLSKCLVVSAQWPATFI